MTYEYRCVAGPAMISIRRPEDRSRAVLAFEDIINQEAREGWDYVGIDEFQVSEPSGCLGLGKPRISLCKMLVFRRPADPAAMPKRDPRVVHRPEPRPEPRSDRRPDPHLGPRPEPAPERDGEFRGGGEGIDRPPDPREPRLR